MIYYTLKELTSRAANWRDTTEFITRHNHEQLLTDKTEEILGLTALLAEVRGEKAGIEQGLITANKRIRDLENLPYELG